MFSCRLEVFFKDGVRYVELSVWKLEFVTLESFPNKVTEILKAKSKKKIYRGTNFILIGDMLEMDPLI